MVICGSRNLRLSLIIVGLVVVIASECKALDFVVNTPSFATKDEVLAIPNIEGEWEGESIGIPGFDRSNVKLTISARSPCGYLLSNTSGSSVLLYPIEKTATNKGFYAWVTVAAKENAQINEQREQPTHGWPVAVYLKRDRLVIDPIGNDTKDLMNSFERKHVAVTYSVLQAMIEVDSEWPEFWSVLRDVHKADIDSRHDKIVGEHSAVYKRN